MLSGLELPGRLLIITTYYSLFTTHYSLLTIHSSPFTTHHSLLTSVLFTTLSIQPTTPLLTVYYSLLASGPFYYPLHTTHYLLLTAYYYSYGKAGSSAALPCAAGRFGNATDLQATEQCTLCPLGHSCSTGSSAPTPCSPCGPHWAACLPSVLKWHLPVSDELQNVPSLRPWLWYLLPGSNPRVVE